MYVDEKSILEKQDVEKDYRNLINKIQDTKSYAKDSLSERTIPNKHLTI